LELQHKFVWKRHQSNKSWRRKSFYWQLQNIGNAEGNIFTQIDDRKRLKQFGVSGNEKQTLSEIKTKNQEFASQTISYYQTASVRFKNGKMKAK
jgi:hypothetical protein